MIQTILEMLKLDCKVCRIDRGYRSGPDWGIVVYYNSSVACIKKYDRDGLYTGLKLMWVSDIESITYNGNDMDARSRFISDRGLNLDPIALDCSGFDEFIDSATKQLGYVCLNDDKGENCYIGPVIAHDDDWIHILDYGNPSRRDKIDVVIAKSQIQSLSVEDLYDQNLMKLHGVKAW